MAAVTLWIVAAMSATLITVTGLHSTGALAAQSSNTATPPGTSAAGRELPANASPSLLPSPSASTTAAPALAPTFAFTPTALPSKPVTPPRLGAGIGIGLRVRVAVGYLHPDADPGTDAYAQADPHPHPDADAHADRYADSHPQLTASV